MAGLLDFLPEDPQKREAARMGLLNFGASMLANSRQGFGGALGQGLLSGTQTYKAQMDGLPQAELQRLQLEQARRGAETERGIQQAGKDSMPVSGGVFDSGGFISRVMAIDPMKGLSLQQSMAKQTPFGKIDPKDYTPESVAAFIQSNNFGDLVPLREMKVGPAGQVYDPVKIQPGQTLADPNRPFSVGPDGAPVPNQAYQQYEIGKARAGKTDINNFVGTKETFKNERDLRNDFQGLPTTKAFREVQGAYDQISFALKNPSAANDLVAATKFMKLLDPGSVVRESELAMAMSATGMLDRFTNYAAMIQKGHKLTPNQRKDFYASAEGLYAAASERYNQSAQEYRGIAGEHGLNSDRVAKPAQIPAAPTNPPAINAGGIKFLGFE